MFHRVSVFCLVLLIAACGKNGGNPTQPTSPTPTTPTRVLSLSGDVGFGDVELGGSTERTLRIANTGNSPMTVTSLSVTSGSPITASWLTGTVAAGGAQDVVLRFTPTTTASVNGTIRVNADHTAGNNQVSFSGRGVRTGPLWELAGSGNTVFDMPTSISRVRVVGVCRGKSSNLVVWIGGRLVVNELVGRSWNQERYEGVHLTTGGVVEIRNSSGVDWSLTEVRE